MIEPHPSFPPPPNPDVKLWRYMDLSKYLALLQSSSLYFPRADRLGDPFEGSASRKTVEAMQNLMAARGEDASERWQAATKFMSKLRRDEVPRFYVSCWHASEHESAAMWKLYSQSSDAVAIQTTFPKLAAELPECVSMGAITYIDYEADYIDPGNAFNFIMSKRISFEHEREVRAVAWKASLEEEPHPRVTLDEGGASVSVDVNAIVERVYVSPDAPPWFRAVVENATRTYGLKAPLEQSRLASDPVY